MKLSLLAVVVLSSASSLSAVAADVTQSREAVSHAGRMLSAAHSRVDSAAASYGSGTPAAWANASESAARERANAQAQMKGAISQLANATASQTGPMATPAVSATATLQGTPKVNTPQAVPSLQRTPSYSVPTVKAQLTPQRVPAKQPQITGVSYRAYVNQLQAATINVAAATLKPDTPVKVTIEGITHTVPASALTPSTQVAIPHIPAFTHTTTTGNTHDKAGHSSVSGHDNRGNDNEHSHAFGGHGYGAENSRSEGFGGHSHFH